MKARDFCYWLQGYIELTEKGLPNACVSRLDSDQVRCIRHHLAMVFAHEIDPETNAESPDGGKKLGHIHGGQIMPPNDVRPRC